MVIEMENLNLGTVTTQIDFAIDITSGKFKTKSLTSP